MNIIILAGARTSDRESYPFYLTEVDHCPLIQILSETFVSIENSQVIIPISAEDDARYNVKSAIEQIINEPTVITCKKNRGALLSALMCSDSMDMDAPLLVLNGNEYVDCDIIDLIGMFSASSFDAGLVCFESIHPRYSHAIVHENVVEKIVFDDVSGGKACTGLIWFRKASDFFDAACTTVLKKNASSDQFYFNSVVNQMVLDQKQVYAHEVDNRCYYPLKTAADMVSLRELLRKTNYEKA